jgi:hypothetical protein
MLLITTQCQSLFVKGASATLSAVEALTLAEGLTLKMERHVPTPR